MCRLSFLVWGTLRGQDDHDYFTCYNETIISHVIFRRSTTPVSVLDVEGVWLKDDPTYTLFLRFMYIKKGNFLLNEGIEKWNRIDEEDRGRKSFTLNED